MGGKLFHLRRKKVTLGGMIVDRPTQLICISDIYLFICRQTNTKDIAGQSASGMMECNGMV